jgi:predicted PurR-regulated permease PerM
MIVGLLIYLLYRFITVIKPFILALILAYVLAPLTNWFQVRFKIRRGLAKLLSYFSLVLTVIAILALLVPLFAEQAANLDLDFQRFISQAESFLGRQYSLAGLVINVETLIQQLDSLVRGVVEPGVGQTLTMLFEVISSFV